MLNLSLGLLLQAGGQSGVSATHDLTLSANNGAGDDLGTLTLPSGYAFGAQQAITLTATWAGGLVGEVEVKVEPDGSVLFVNCTPDGGSSSTSATAITDLVPSGEIITLAFADQVQAWEVGSEVLPAFSAGLPGYTAIGDVTFDGSGGVDIVATTGAAGLIRYFLAEGVQYLTELDVSIIDGRATWRHAYEDFDVAIDADGVFAAVFTSGASDRIEVTRFSNGEDNNLKINSLSVREALAQRNVSIASFTALGTLAIASEMRLDDASANSALRGSVTAGTTFEAIASPGGNIDFENIDGVTISDAGTELVYLHPTAVGNLMTGYRTHPLGSEFFSFDATAGTLTLTRSDTGPTQYTHDVSALDLGCAQHAVAVSGTERMLYMYSVDVNGVEAFTSHPLVSLGAEGVINGDFATGDLTGYISVFQATVESGRARITSPDGSFAGFAQSVLFDAPKTVLISVDIEHVSNPTNNKVQIDDLSPTGSLVSAAAFDIEPDGVSGTFVAVVDCSGGVRLNPKRDGGATDFYIDNISVKEITAESLLPNMLDVAIAGLSRPTQVVNARRLANLLIATTANVNTTTGAVSAISDGSSGTDPIWIAPKLSAISDNPTTAKGQITAQLAALPDASGKPTQNLFSEPNEMDGASWGASRAVIMSGGDGIFQLTQNVEDFDGSVAQNVTVQANDTFTVSIEAKPGTWDYLFIRELHLDGSANDTFFNLSTGSVGITNAGHTATIISTSDGFYRCSIEATNDGTGRSGNVKFFLSEDNDNTLAQVGDIGEYIIIRNPVFSVDLATRIGSPTEGTTPDNAEALTYVQAFTVPGADRVDEIDIDGHVIVSFDGTTATAAGTWPAGGNHSLTATVTTLRDLTLDVGVAISIPVNLQGAESASEVGGIAEAGAEEAKVLIGAESASETGSITGTIQGVLAGAESASEVGSVVGTIQGVLTGAESASEVGGIAEVGASVPDPVTYDGLLIDPITDSDLPYNVAQHFTGEGSLAYTLTSGPAGVSLDIDTGILSGTFTGTASASISVDNGSGSPVVVSANFNEASSAETLTGAESASEVGSIVGTIQGILAGAESTSEVGEIVAEALDFAVQRSTLNVGPEIVPMEVDLATLGSFTTPAPTGSEVHDRRLHELDYEWSIDDALGSASKIVRVLPNWNNRSKHYGPAIQHCFGPGAWDVTLTVTDPATGLQKSTVKQVVVGAANSVYASGKTICVNPVGDADFTGAPSGAVEVNADTWAAGETAFDANMSTTEIRRILFKRGGTYTLNCDFGASGSGHYEAHGGLFFGAYGTGARPIINVPNSDIGIRGHGDWDAIITNRDIRVEGLNFQSTYDPTTEKPTAAGAHADRPIRIDLPVNLHVDDCIIDGFKAGAIYWQDYPTGGTGSTTQTLVGIANSEITNFGGDYAIFTIGSDNPNVSVGVFANRIHNPANSRFEASGYRSCVRINNASRQYVALNEMLLTDPAQPVLKLANTPHYDGDVVVCDRNWLAGSFEGVTVGSNITSDSPGLVRSTVTNAIIRHNVIEGGAVPQQLALFRSSGVSFENNLCIQLSGTKVTGSGMHDFIELQYREPTTLPAWVSGAPISICGNTFVCLRDETENNDTSNGIPVIYEENDMDASGNGYTAIIEDDNIRHVPNSSASGGPVTTYAPLSANAIGDAFFIGYHDPDTGALNGASVPAETELYSYAPLAGSSAIGAASETRQLYRQVDTSLRDASPDIGGWEIGGVTLTGAESASEVGSIVGTIQGVLSGVESASEVGGIAADMEAGLTLTDTFAQLATINSLDVDRAKHCVFAIDIDFSGSPTGVIYEQGGNLNGAYVGVRSSTGDLLFRFGDGQQPSPFAGHTSLLVASGNKPTGSGTLVWEFNFAAGTGGDLKAWWNGSELTGTLNAQNDETSWAGTDEGSVLQAGGGQTFPGETVTAWSGSASSGLRYYEDQTISTRLYGLLGAESASEVGGISGTIQGVLTGAESASEVGEIVDANAFDPEAGLTLTNTFSDLSTIASAALDRTVDTVFAISLDFSGSPDGVIYEQGASGIGAYVGVQASGHAFNPGDLIFRFGNGAQPSPHADHTSFIVAAANVPTGTGTLVWEFDFTGDDIRVWWNGELLPGTLDAGNLEASWAGTDDGSVLQKGGSIMVSGQTETAWSGGASIDYGRGTGLRHYENQLVTVPA